MYYSVICFGKLIMCALYSGNRTQLIKPTTNQQNASTVKQYYSTSKSVLNQELAEVPIISEPLTMAVNPRLPQEVSD